MPNCEERVERFKTDHVQNTRFFMRRSYGVEDSIVLALGAL
jgi:hypothetical protein